MPAPSTRIDELKRRVDEDPASLAFAALGEEYRRLGKLAEAVEACRAGLPRHPEYVSARVTLARALLELGDQEAARVEFERVIRQAPENLAAIRGLAEICRRPAEGLGAAAAAARSQAQETPGAALAPAVVSEAVEAGRPSVDAEPTAVGPEAAAGLRRFLDDIRRTRAELGR